MLPRKLLLVSVALVVLTAETPTLTSTAWAEVASSHSFGPVRQVTELRGADSRPNNEFGSAVAVSGSTTGTVAWHLSRRAFFRDRPVFIRRMARRFHLS